LKKYDHLRVAARKWRLDDNLSLPEICDRLSLSKGTVHHWLKGIPLQRRSRSGDNLRQEGYLGRNVLRLRGLREEAHRKGVIEYQSLLESDPTFRDFIMLFLTEGSRCERNSVAIANSNPRLIQLAYHWLRRLANPARAFDFRVQIHTDQNITELVQFWSIQLQVNPDLIRLQRKSNSGRLSGRVWRSKYGVLTVRVSDTYLRCRLEAWMTLLQDSWYFQGVAQSGRASALGAEGLHVRVVSP
jgi:hypothetical protein